MKNSNTVKAISNDLLTTQWIFASRFDSWRHIRTR